MMRKDGEGEGSACSYSTGGKTTQRAFNGSPAARGAQGKNSRPFMVWAHLSSSAVLGQAQLTLAGAHSHICSSRV